MASSLSSFLPSFLPICFPSFLPSFLLSFLPYFIPTSPSSFLSFLLFFLLLFFYLLSLSSHHSLSLSLSLSFRSLPMWPCTLFLPNLSVPLCYLMLEGRKDPSKVGLMYLCTFTLLKLSGERSFGVCLNQPYVLTLPVDVPPFSGTSESESESELS